MNAGRKEQKKSRKKKHLVHGSILLKNTLRRSEKESIPKKSGRRLAKFSWQTKQMKKKNRDSLQKRRRQKNGNDKNERKRKCRKTRHVSQWSYFLRNF